MNWTKQKPSEPGWYCYRPAPETDTIKVWVYFEGTGDLCATWSDSIESVADMHGEWAKDMSN